MKFNIKVFKANKGNAKAAYLYARDKHIVIEETYEEENGNIAMKRLYSEHPEIKSNWEVVMTTL